MAQFDNLMLAQHTQGVVPELWFVGAEATAKYLVNDGSGVFYINDIRKKNLLYFMSENEAHLAAAEYYDFHGERYPYINEWGDAITRQADSIVDEMISEGASQVMEFI